jgi:hypothetical protein
MNSSCSFVFFSSESNSSLAILLLPVGVEKYSLAIQLIFSSFDNLENLLWRYSQ